VTARRILEECRTTAEAEALATKDRPAERHTLVTCDVNGGRILEITPKTLKSRTGENGLVFAANRFVCDGLALADRGIVPCPRTEVFRKTAWANAVTPDDVAKAMHAVCQKDWTAHTLVLEPATLKLKVAFGDGQKSATEVPMTEVDLKELFGVR
jgi:hypothetical protein